MKRKETTHNHQSDSRVYLQNMIKILPHSGNIWWKDKDLKYLGCNDRVIQILGLESRKDFISKTDYEIWGSNIASKLEEADLYVLETGKSIDLEETIIEFTGKKAIMQTRKSPLLDDHGNIIGIIGASTDITAFKNTELRLKETEESLMGIKALGASIAHELRTPLSAIQFGISGTKDYLPALIKAYLMAKEHCLDVEPIQSEHLKILANMLENVASEVMHAETIINMILMSVKQNNISPNQFELCSIEECVREAMLRYPFKSGERELVSFNNENDFLFLGDKTFMMHVLFNLTKNALYYIKAAKKGKIHIWCDSDGENNILHFQDTAKGIASDILPKLFEKFYTTTPHGTGLGLAFCRMVMTSFGGEISCTSKYGEFTEFQMTFSRRVFK